MTGPRTERWLVWCVLAHVTLLPISIALSQPFAFVAAVLVVWVVWSQRGTPHPLHPLRWYVLAFAALAVASLGWSIRPAQTADKLDRMLLLGMTMAIPWLTIRGSSPWSRDGLWHLVLLFIAGATIQAAMDVVRIPLAFHYALQNHDVLVHAGERSARALRPTWFDMGNMRDPQMYMVSLSLLVGWMLYRRSDGGLRWWWLAAALNSAAFVLHFKRGAWLAFLASAALMALLARRRRILLVLVLVAASALAMPQVRERLSLLKDEMRLKTGGRYALWTEVGPRMMEEHPWGLGWKAARHEDFTRYSVRIQPKLNHLHNNALQMRLELGWPGLAAWLAWMGAGGFLMISGYRRLAGNGDSLAGIGYGVSGGYLALHFNGLVEYNFGDAEIFMLFNVLFGLAVALAWVQVPSSNDVAPTNSRLPRVSKAGLPTADRSPPAAGV